MKGTTGTGKYHLVKTLFSQQFNRICCCSVGIAPRHKLSLLKGADKARDAQLPVAQEMEVQASQKVRQVYEQIFGLVRNKQQ